MRVVAIRWGTPPPTAVDEELAVYDDGRARLLVAAPRDGGPTVGTFEGAIAPDDVAALVEAGSFEIDLRRQVVELRYVEAARVAERVAADLRARPLALAGFHARVLPGIEGRARVALGVLGGGTAAIQLELRPDECSVHFERAGADVSWQEFPELETGFVTAAAIGLGGLRSRAVIEPGFVGALTVEVTPPDGADAVRLVVSGVLHDAFSDAPEPRRFEVRTEATPIAP